MHWKIKSAPTTSDPQKRRAEILELLLKSRGHKSSKKRKLFLNPPLPDVNAALDQLPDLDQQQLNKATTRIKTAIEKKQPIIIFGDYDCDGVCSTAILWKSLHQLGANALPFIPHRTEHGYGLSKKGIADALKLFPSTKPLVITVDNGITAIEVAQDLKKNKIDLIITDHHTPLQELPVATAIVHTTHLSGSGVAWLLASTLSPTAVSLELAALGTVCDLLPLTGLNRAIVKHGLTQLAATTNPGLQALYTSSQITDPSTISTYHLGYVLGPKINAVGRLGHALDALRLLCTNSPKSAQDLAAKLSSLNLERQDLTHDYALQAINYFKTIQPLPNILFIASPNYHEGIIGLIASRLTDYFYRPSIVVNKGDAKAKASARSIPGINITKIISKAASLLDGFGGHEQAAGFSANIEHLDAIANTITDQATQIDSALLDRSLTIDVDVLPSDLSFELLDLISQLEPFGVDNPKPIFSTTIPISSHMHIGKTNTHLKLKPAQPHDSLDIIGFGMAGRQQDYTTPTLAFSLQKNTFRGNTSLQLLLKDIKDS